MYVLISMTDCERPSAYYASENIEVLKREAASFSEDVLDWEDIVIDDVYYYSEAFCNQDSTVLKIQKVEKI